ncbi:hypothetical protein TSUD_284180 [Trifolium subterraneum]|uniref:Aldose 1-epimerase n=1 Tax=Trifolium subterraneum TaxID=3900 RepID=A0A2Z6PC11_TRISU|nr:hypothetical protein TSUD_284180 [Trifolium subterraneum]
MSKIFMLLSLIFLVASGFVNGSIKKENNHIDDIKLFELKKGDLTLKVTNWGATLVSLILPDKNGFPGDLKVTVSYILGKNSLTILMQAKALNKPTPVNLVNHAYWNLGNHNSGNILHEVVQIFGSKNTIFDDNLIPTGKISSIKGTPNDFLKPQIVGTRINQLPKTNGYNVNYVLNKGKSGNKEELKVAAIVFDKKSGRVMKLSTNAPGLQFYTANFVKNDKGKGGFVYQPRSALCLESQAFPDSSVHKAVKRERGGYIAEVVSVVCHEIPIDKGTRESSLLVQVALYHPSHGTCDSLAILFSYRSGSARLFVAEED